MNIRLFKQVNNEIIIILLIFFLFAFIRIYKLTTVPHGFHRDEAYTGYNAFSILKTGKDEWGKRFPIFSRSFGDYPPALILYFTAPFVFLFGLNEFGVRISTVVFSVINFCLIGFILKKLKFDKKLIMIILGLIAISPWEITQVRGANGDLILGISFFLLGVYFLINLWQNRSLKNLMPFFICWLLTYFSYNSFRIQIPLLIIGFIPLVLLNNNLKNKKIILFIFLFLLIIPFLFTYFFPESNIRGKQVLFIYDASIAKSLETLALRAGLMKSPFILIRMFHNKFSYLLFSFIKNSIKFFSLEFLYLMEAIPRRYSVSENGLFLYVTAPLLLLGLVFFGQGKIKLSYKLFFLYFIFISFFPSIITTDDFPNSKRCFLAFYPLIFLIGLGFYKIYQKIFFRRISLILYSLLLGLNFFYFWYFYEFHSPFLTAHSRNYFYKQIAQVAKGNINNYDRIKIYTFSEAPHILILFFTQYDPVKYHSYTKSGINLDLFANKVEWGFDKYFFTPEECPNPKKNELVFADVSKCNLLTEKVKANEWEIKGYIFSPYGSREFVYYQLKSI